MAKKFVDLTQRSLWYVAALIFLLSGALASLMVTRPLFTLSVLGGAMLAVSYLLDSKLERRKAYGLFVFWIMAILLWGYLGVITK